MFLQTHGWAITATILDLMGGVFSLAQMFLLAYNHGELFFTTLPNWSVMEKLNFPKFSAYRWLVYIKWECGQAWSRIVLCDVWCHLFNTTFYSLRVIFTTNLFNAFTLIKKDYFFRNHRREDKRALLNELWNIRYFMSLWNRFLNIILLLVAQFFL